MNVLLNKQVTKTQISKGVDGNVKVNVTTSDNMSYLVDSVIITVPLGVLKAGTISFDPPLSKAKTQAIQRTGKHMNLL